MRLNFLTARSLMWFHGEGDARNLVDCKCSPDRLGVIRMWLISPSDSAILLTRQLSSEKPKYKIFTSVFSDLKSHRGLAGFSNELSRLSLYCSPYIYIVSFILISSCILVYHGINCTTWPLRIFPFDKTSRDLFFLIFPRYYALFNCT